MYGQRGIAEMLNICKDIREVADPNVLLLNYANPMAMLTWACNKYGGVQYDRSMSWCSRRTLANRESFRLGEERSRYHLRGN